MLSYWILLVVLILSAPFVWYFAIRGRRVQRDQRTRQIFSFSFDSIAPGSEGRARFEQTLSDAIWINRIVLSESEHWSVMDVLVDGSGVLMCEVPGCMFSVNSPDVLLLPSLKRGSSLEIVLVNRSDEPRAVHAAALLTTMNMATVVEDAPLISLLRGFWLRLVVMMKYRMRARADLSSDKIPSHWPGRWRDVVPSKDRRDAE